MYLDDQWFQTVVRSRKRYQSFCSINSNRLCEKVVHTSIKSGDFLKKIKNLGSLPENSILVTANAVGLYPSTSHEAGLQALKEALENRHHKQIPTDKLVKMAQFVLQNNFFEFISDVFQQISGTAVGTRFAPPYAFIYMAQIEIKFLRTQNHQTIVWFKYIEDNFFYLESWTEKLETFMADFNVFNPNTQFTHESSKKRNHLFTNTQFTHASSKKGIASLLILN